jgi:hypothetical protein
MARRTTFMRAIDASLAVVCIVPAASVALAVDDRTEAAGLPAIVARRAGSFVVLWLRLCALLYCRGPQF